MNTSAFRIDLNRLNNNSDNNNINNGINTATVNHLNNLNVNVNSNSVNHDNQAGSDIRVGSYAPSCVNGLPVGGLSTGPFIPNLRPEAFYPHPQPAFDFKENIEAWTQSYLYADFPILRPGLGVSLNGIQRKNATRETTSTLKAWLNDHRKNPYPTKAEKIMLAIMTQMTLTQVSTWFANARRRLKKENKMTWSPRNRCDEIDDTSDIDVETPMDVIAPLGPVNIISPSPSSSYSTPSPSSSTSSGTSTTFNSNFIKNETHPHPHRNVSSAKPKIWSIVDTAIN